MTGRNLCEEIVFEPCTMKQRTGKTVTRVIDDLQTAPNEKIAQVVDGTVNGEKKCQTVS